MPGVKKVGKDAFNRCSNLTKVTIPAGVSEIGELAFFACVRLTCVHLPPSLKNIRRWAFKECDRLGQVRVPRDTVYIKDGDYRSFPETCSIRRLEPHIRATFLLCLYATSDVQHAKLGTLELARARDNFRNAGEGIGPWRSILTFI